MVGVMSRAIRGQDPAGDDRPGPLADELRTAVMRTSRRIRTEGATGAVTQSQYAVLAALRNSPSTLSALAEREQMRPPSMTRTVDALELRQLVTRHPDPTDRRHVIVTLTDSGRSLLNETRRLRTEWLNRRLARLDPAERQILTQAAAILKKMSAQ
jgi:DNA-binding MarR family transcriptional regulator